MDIINRAMILINPKQPYIDWVLSLAKDNEDLAAITEDLKKDATAILIPDFEHRSETLEYIQELINDIFDLELCGWCADEELWPKNRDQDLFEQWFDIQLHDVVVDSVEPAEEMADDEEL